jgi:hypothetical protein
MPCDDDNYVRAQATHSSDETQATGPVTSGRVLIVSDAPERIPQHYSMTGLPLVSGSESEDYATAETNPTTHTLYRCEVPLEASQAKSFRVFFWHESAIGDPIYLMVVAHVSTGSATISNFRAETVSSIVSGGQALAESILCETIPAATPLTSSLSTNGQAIWRLQIPASGFRGAVLEFDITAMSDCDLRLRTCVSESTAVAGSWTDPVAWPKQVRSDPIHGDVVSVHVRGWWPYSRVEMDAGSMSVVAIPDPGNSREIAIINQIPCVEVGASTYGNQSADTHGTSRGNAGAWGAVLAYRFLFTNDGMAADEGGVGMRSRNVGAPWWGAARVTTPSYPGRGVPPIGGTTGYHVVGLTTDTSGGSDPIEVPGNGGEQEVLVEVVNGGGSTLPVNVRCHAIHTNQDPGDPGGSE